jgi:hypothetical protein
MSRLNRGSVTEMEGNAGIKKDTSSRLVRRIKKRREMMKYEGSKA